MRWPRWLRNLGWYLRYATPLRKLVKRDQSGEELIIVDAKITETPVSSLRHWAPYRDMNE
jgi:hypothetical protein